MSWIFAALIVVGVALEVAGDIFLKKWADGGSRTWFVVGFTLYLAGTLAWARSLKYEDLSKAAVLFTVANMLAVVVAGAALFGEKLTAWNWLGVALGAASIVLCEADL
jgi:multidrug transporter EmrE-like cation transporter